MEVCIAEDAHFGLAGGDLGGDLELLFQFAEFFEFSFEIVDVFGGTAVFSGGCFVGYLGGGSW